MKNMDVEIKGNELVIRVDLTKDCGASKSGKSIMIGSSEGNAKIIHGDKTIMIGLNVFQPKD